MKVELIRTSDGSDSLFVPELDETYHSKHGALTESQHVFIDNGYIAASNRFENIRLFEVGFGTGLNAFLTMQKAKSLQCTTEYNAIELYPLSKIILRRFNQNSEGDFNIEALLSMHNCSWDQLIQLNPYFQLRKIQADFLDYQMNGQFNLIYFDAFAPEKQIDMWSKDIFERLYNALEKGGILTTYCVKGIVKRRLKEIGFTIERLPGPLGGKREMLRATKE